MSAHNSVLATMLLLSIATTANAIEQKKTIWKLQSGGTLLSSLDGCAVALDADAEVANILDSLITQGTAASNITALTGSKTLPGVELKQVCKVARKSLASNGRAADGETNCQLVQTYQGQTHVQTTRTVFKIVRTDSNTIVADQLLTMSVGSQTYPGQPTQAKFEKC